MSCLLFYNVLSFVCFCFLYRAIGLWTIICRAKQVRSDSRWFVSTLAMHGIPLEELSNCTLIDLSGI